MNPPTAMIIGKTTGKTQTAGAPSCAPQSPTATIARIWSQPEIGCLNPLANPAALPTSACAYADCVHSANAMIAKGSSDRKRERWLISISKALEHQQGSLNRPIRPQPADAPGGQLFHPRRPTNLERPKGTLQQKNHHDKKELANFDTNVKRQTCQWNL